jgi:hypothetical protein
LSSAYVDPHVKTIHQFALVQTNHDADRRELSLKFSSGLGHGEQYLSKSDHNHRDGLQISTLIRKRRSIA